MPTKRDEVISIAMQKYEAWMALNNTNNVVIQDIIVNNYTTPAAPEWPPMACCAFTVKYYDPSVVWLA